MQPHATAVNVPYSEGKSAKNVLRRVRPDGVELFYALADDLEEAIAGASEMNEWSFSKSTLYVQRWTQRNDQHRLDWEVKIEA